MHMKVFITTPAIKRIKASASAEVDVEEVLASADELTLGASSGAIIKC